MNVGELACKEFVPVAVRCSGKRYVLVNVWAKLYAERNVPEPRKVQLTISLPVDRLET